MTPTTMTEGPQLGGPFERPDFAGVAAAVATAGPVGRKSILMGLAASMGAGLTGLAAASPARAQTGALVGAVRPRTVSVASTGATGDGVTDDTAAVRAAIISAAGGETYFPPGTYVLDGLVVDNAARLQLDPAATLLAKPNSSKGEMIAFVGTELIIRGGTINGNRANQSGRPVIVGSEVQQGKTVDIAEVHFTGTVKAVLYMSNFGGLASIQRCLFTDQAEHTGVLNEGLSAIVFVTSGQPGVKGYLKFSDNRAFGTVTPREPGSNPGGVFVSPSPSDNPEAGNLTTLDASGNYFWGYGQNLSGNTISAIHLYRSTLAARITGNYFEESSIAAVTAKSVTDFVCVNNVFVGGAISPQNPSDLGVISYVPGYNAGSVVQPRGVITGNVIEGAGGQSTNLRQSGISVHGTPSSHGTEVIVAGNVINGGGLGINVRYVDDIAVSGNIVKTGAGGIRTDYVSNLMLNGNIVRSAAAGAAGSQYGVSLNFMSGWVHVSDNLVETLNGHGLIALQGMSTARLTAQGNRFKHAATGSYAVVARGVAFLKLMGNEINAPVGGAIDVRADSAGNTVGVLAYDLTNTVVAGTVTFVWPDIGKATGQLRAAGSPLGAVAPGEPGTTYQQTDGTGAGVLWTALGTTSSSWAKVLGGTPAGSAGANRMLGMTFDPACATVSQLPAKAGVLHLARVHLPLGGAPSKVTFSVSKAGTGLLAARCFIGIYSAAGTLLARSGDLASTLKTTGNKTVTLAAPAPAQTPGSDVLVGLVWSGTTGPELRASGSAMANIGIVAATDARYALGGSGLTALPTTRPTPAFSGAAPWFGVA